MPRILILCLILILTACASLPSKPDYTPLTRSLISQDRSAIITERGLLILPVKTNNIINLYLLMIENKPNAIVSNSKLLLNNILHYTLYEQQILKPILLWAYLHPIYRRESATDIRILQKEELLVAPSDIDFNRCLTKQAGCANLMRGRLEAITSPQEINSHLIKMANNDPCINLTDKNLSGDFAKQCLANRKGDLEINLLSPPKFLAEQWLAVLENKQAFE